MHLLRGNRFGCSLGRSCWRLPWSQNACPGCESELCLAWFAPLTNTHRGISTDWFCHPPLPCPMLRLEIQQLWADCYQALARTVNLMCSSSLAALTPASLLRLSEAGNPLLLFAESSRDKMIKQQHTQDRRHPNLLWSSLLDIHMTASCPTQWLERKSMETGQKWYHLIHAKCVPHDGGEYVFGGAWNLSEIQPRAVLPVSVHRTRGGLWQQRGLHAHHCFGGSQGSKTREENASRTAERNADSAPFQGNFLVRFVEQQISI